jgi:NADPH-dependent curcumin reductase CurA
MSLRERSNREIRLKRRPNGTAVPEDFELVETPMPVPEGGQVLVRNIYLSVDPALRNRLAGDRSYGAGFGIGDTIPGGAVGQVMAARGNPDFKTGDYVLSLAGLREYFTSDGKTLEKLDASAAPLQAYIGALGTTGLTAWGAVVHDHPLKAGQKVFVSAAAGAVGNIVCQIAKLKGCYVVGSTGSDEKCTWLKKELGVDETINYRSGSLSLSLRKAFPDGIDFFFDNVGGDHFTAALDNMANHGHILICGVIQQYNRDGPMELHGRLTQITSKRLTTQGFVVWDHIGRKPEFLREMIGWHKDGRLKFEDTIVDGIENAVGAFIDLFSGRNFGKMIVRLAPERV